MTICICGGGNLGHVTAGFLASNEQIYVNVLTRNPEKWSNSILVHTPDGNIREGKLNSISSNPHEVVSNANIVLFCLPGYSIGQVLHQIASSLCPDTWVGSVVSSTGFFFEAMKVLPKNNPLFGFQRVPFISRTIKYGSEADLLGFKKELQVAVEHATDKEPIRATMEYLFNTPVKLLNNYLEASLSNSNPLLHPARLYSLWKDWKEDTVYSRIPLFYEEWTEEAAQLYIDMDAEFQKLLRILPVTSGCIPNVLEYYESYDAASLAQKLRSINAFKGIAAPMIKVTGGYAPDFNSRYFTEDFPYGLNIIHQIAKNNHIKAPTIETISNWGAVISKHNK